MIFRFYKQLSKSGADAIVSDENGVFFCKMDFVKNGVLLHNESEGLVAQLFKDNEGVRISVADGGSLRVFNSGKITPELSLDENEKKEVAQDKLRGISGGYSIFGQPRNYRYDVFLSANSKSTEVASVAPNNWQGDTFMVRISEDTNALRALCIVLAFALINQ